MTEEELEAIAGGYNGDAFAVLGPHAVSGDGKREWEIRAFLPQAKQAEAAVDVKLAAMQRVHPAGVFVARLESEPG
ncbi:MAG: GlgB N-terminal domain-containing protein, partial [Bryobacteraceae bacterium]